MAMKLPTAFTDNDNSSENLRPNLKCLQRIVTFCDFVWLD
jgi:hypothetical protein